ncbi:hypothetical protein AUK40_02670 [Candidatus Wirthbacteria bacterium CG2_30_54_11]|uniref:Hydrogenase n=1 Tax=Candidatus Wirthbacteria bacterium CG2_30_54_11 TaxID=1817892 RepID=A0A1J5J2M0_9BACT|nr:MAG: hypothetical protein AUK40_02670 [Candidatus Wirthbacteria bacterium CG2_30_54_11]
MHLSLPGIILAFREALEALLIITIILRFLDRTQNAHLKKHVLLGVSLSLGVSVIAGLGLFAVVRELESLENIGELYNSIASLAAVFLIITFIVWMIRHGRDLGEQIETKAALSLSPGGILALTTLLISREGLEIAIFTIAGQFDAASILLGVLLAVLISYLLSRALIRINFPAVFRFTLLYLIIQTGYLAGHGLHEGLSAINTLGYIGDHSVLLSKAFDLSHGLLAHHEGLLGLPLNVLVGWYADPEWLQFLTQYLTTGLLLWYWGRPDRQQTNSR